MKKQEDQLFHTDPWHTYQFEKFMDDLDPASADAQFIADSARQLYSLPRFTREVFSRLYGNPERVAQVRPEDAWAEKAHKELEESPDFVHLRTTCAGDRMRAGAAALEITRAVAAKLPSGTKIEDPEELRQQIRALIEFGQKAQPVDESVIDAVKAQGKKRVQAAVAFAQAVDPTAIRNAIKAGGALAEERIETEETCALSFAAWSAGGPDADPVTHNAALKAQLAKHVMRSPKLRELAMLAGRMKRTAVHKQRTKADYLRCEVTDIEMGADLDRLLPAELVKLTDPTLALDFYRRFHERALLQYKLEGKEPQVHGPIVFALDDSGSMGEDRAKKEIWAKAFAMGLIQIGQMQKRDVCGIWFSHYIVKVVTWRPGKIDPAALMAEMADIDGGYTNFELPLARAKEIIDGAGEKNRFKRADIVFITDGRANVSRDFVEDFAKWKVSRGVTCYAVHVGTHNIGPLHLFGDKVLKIRDVANDIAAHTIYEM